jgi:hypothetical protein
MPGMRKTVDTEEILARAREGLALNLKELAVAGRSSAYPKCAAGTHAINLNQDAHSEEPEIALS